MKASAPPQITVPQLPVVAQPMAPAEEALVSPDFAPAAGVEQLQVEVKRAEPGRFVKFCQRARERHPYLVGVPAAVLGKFLNFYHRANERHPYLTGVATASSVYIVGDAVAQTIKGGASAQLLPTIAVGVGMSLYYGWESPLIFRVIDRAFPLGEKSSDGEDRSEHLVEGAAVMTGQQSEGGLLRRIGRAILRRKRKIIRAAAYRIPIAPSWTVRHVGVLALVHGSTSTVGGLVLGSIALWATWLPLLSIEEYVVQNKIPLEYRFLAASAVTFVWQISAALVALI